jgi:hypothetical protein
MNQFENQIFISLCYQIDIWPIVSGSQSQSYAFLFISFLNQPRWLLNRVPHERSVPLVSSLWPHRVAALHLRPCHHTTLLSACLPRPLCTREMTQLTYHLHGPPRFPSPPFLFRSTTDRSPPAASGPINRTKTFSVPHLTHSYCYPHFSVP